MLKFPAPSSIKSNRAVQLKHLTWENGHWRTSDQRPQWASFHNEQLEIGSKKFRIRQSLSVDIDISDIFEDGEDAEEIQNITSTLLKKIETCELDYLYLGNQNITYAEYLKMTSSKKVQELILNFVNIRDDKSGVIVPLERVLAAVPKLHKMIIQGDSSAESKFTAETAKKLFELRPFKKLAYFELRDIPEIFKIDDFCKFIEKHLNGVAFHLHLADFVSIGYKKKFYAAMNTIVEKWKNSVYITINGRGYPFEC